MEIKLAKSAGFCFGVKRAVETVYEQIREQKEQKIYTYGPIIHNDEVIRDLKEKGVCVLETEEELGKVKDGVVIIRSHGVPKRVCSMLEKKGIPYVDATCPFVKKYIGLFQNKVQEARISLSSGIPTTRSERDTGMGKEDVKVVFTAEDAQAVTVEEENPCASWPKRHIITINSKI